MLQVILELMAELVVEIVLRPVLILAAWVAWWLVMFPLLWILCAPFILLRAIFFGADYWMAVVNMFRSVHEYWRTHGLSELYF